MKKVLGRQEITRSPHSLGRVPGLALGRQLFWLAALLSLLLIACGGQEAPVQPVSSDPGQSDQAQTPPAQSNSQAIVPTSDSTNSAGIVSANAAVEPTVQPEPQPANESTKPVPEDEPDPVSPQMQLLNVADTVEAQTPPAQSNSQAIVPTSDSTNSAGIVSANAAVEPTVQPEPQPANESTKPVPEDEPDPVSPK